MDEEDKEIIELVSREQFIRLQCLELARVTSGPDENTSDLIRAAKRFEDYIERGY